MRPKLFTFFSVSAAARLPSHHVIKSSPSMISSSDCIIFMAVWSVRFPIGYLCFFFFFFCLLFLLTFSATKQSKG